MITLYLMVVLVQSKNNEDVPEITNMLGVTAVVESQSSWLLSSARRRIANTSTAEFYDSF